MHPSDHPNFNSRSRTPVFYLSHPVAPDERYSFLENMRHIEKIMGMCLKAGVRVVAPYHTLCLIEGDTDDDARRVGLEIDCWIARRMGYIMLVGHKLTRGMAIERDVVWSAVGTILDYTGITDPALEGILGHIAHQYRA